MPDLLTLAEAAQALRVSVRTLEREARDGRLVLVRVRTRRMVARDDLERYIAASRETACPSAASASDGKSAFESALVRAWNARSRAAQPEPTRKRSKLWSAANRSTLRLVADPDT